VNTPANTQPAWRELYPFASHFHTTRHGHRLHYLDEGSGDAVVLLHGNPTWSFLFRDLVRALRPDWRVIVPDHLGCGLSDKPQAHPYCLADHIANLEDLLLGRLGLERMHLVVHDWGGAIGFGLATRHPERVGRLAAFNTAAFHLDRCPLRIRACRLPLLGPLAVRAGNAFARAALHMASARPGGLSPAVRAGYLAPYGTWHDRVAILGFVRDIPLSPRHPTYATLAAIEAGLPALRAHPLLIGWGLRDFCFTAHFLKRWQGFFPEAEVHTFADAGHYMFEDAGERVLPLVQRFLAAAQPAARTRAP
jgi:haloalkane dehalogenase